MTDPPTLFSSIIDRAFNQGDLAVLDDLVSPNFVEHQFETSGQPATPSATHLVGSAVQRLRRDAGDFHLEIEDAVVSGDTVWARLRGTVTDTGGQLGHPPTGKPSRSPSSTWPDSRTARWSNIGEYPTASGCFSRPGRTP